MGAVSSTLSYDPAILPLISSSFALFYAFVETSIFFPFLHSSVAKDFDANRAIQLWWSNFFNWGMGTIFALALANLAGGVYAANQYAPGSQERYLCTGGTLFSMAHFLFGPSVADIIKNLCDEKVAEAKETTVWLRSWLRLHYWRTSLTDVPAVTCFACVVFGWTVSK